MACVWTNKRKAVEVCPGELGSYAYIGYEDPDPDYSLIEVAKDLSGYIKTPLTSPIGSSLYSKQRKIYRTKYDTAPSPNVLSAIERYDGNGVFTPISGHPTGLAAQNKNIIYAAGKLRAINFATGGTDSLYESDDGETWALLPGSVSFGDTAASFPGDYTVLGSRTITARRGGATQRLYFSDDGGATWTTGTGATTTSGGASARAFVQSGSNVIAYADEIYTGTDGASWTKLAGFFNDFFAIGNILASNGTGRLVAAGKQQSTGFSGFAYSSNHGASWTVNNWPAAGVGTAGAFPTIHGMFWDGAQFVVFVDRNDIDAWQIFTSPTGATWTLGIVIPSIQIPPTQIID